MSDDHFYVTLLSNSSQDLYSDNTIAAFTVELARPLNLGPNVNWEVGLCEFTCPSVADDGEGVSMIYCDLISPQYVGGSLVRCLRTYTYQPIEFTNVYYLPVVRQKITNIRIEILTQGGERVAFPSGETPSTLVLHFRRVPVVW